MAAEGTITAGGAGPHGAPDAPVVPARRRKSWPARIAVGLAAVVVAAIVAGFAIRLPYTSISPGDALSLPPRVTVQGGPSYSAARGDIRLLFVREAYRVNVWQWVRASFDSEIDLVKDGEINPDDLTPTQQAEQGFQQMADAKSAATAVALQAAGYKVGLLPGLTVSDLSTDMPAFKVLLWGDEIVSADGRATNSASDLDAVIAKHKAGQVITLVVERAGKRLTVPIKLAVFPDGDAKGRTGIGVVLSPRFEFPLKVNVDTTNIGGPSAGLAMTLAILDDLTPGNLTGGLRVAVTGTIDSQGDVGEIGGIEQKAVAARAAHVSLFIVPQCAPTDPPPYLASCKADLARAVKRAGSKIKVIPVSTFKQALAVLRSAGGAAVTPVASTTSTTVVA